MHEAILTSGAETLLVAFPFILLLFVGMFRLDEVFATPKTALKRQRPACGLDERGEPILCDPDGRLLRRPPPPRVPERMEPSVGCRASSQTTITIP